MEPIRVVRGTGTGPTEMASYDAALCDAGVGDHNLVAVSSVIPAGATVAAVDTAPDLGPVGSRLTVVEAGASSTERASAALAWAQSPSGGLFYEAAGAEPPETARERAETGLAAGQSLREWSFDAAEVRTATARATGDEVASAVVLAAYGDAEPLL